jgi:hypothetical protein
MLTVMYGELSNSNPPYYHTVYSQCIKALLNVFVTGLALKP